MKKKERVVLTPRVKESLNSIKQRKLQGDFNKSEDVEKNQKKLITGITKRWATNTLLITALIFIPIS